MKYEAWTILYAQFYTVCKLSLGGRYRSDDVICQRKWKLSLFPPSCERRCYILIFPPTHFPPRKNEYILVFPPERSVYTHFSGGEISVYTHFSGGKTQYILIFSGRKMSMGEKWVCNTGSKYVWTIPLKSTKGIEIVMLFT